MRAGVTESYDNAIHTLTGERTRKIIEMLSKDSGTLSEIRRSLGDGAKNSDVSYILSALETHELIKRGEYKPGIADGRNVVSQTFVLNREKLVEYVGKVDELATFYRNLL